MKSAITIAFLLTGLLATAASAAELEARLDRSRIAIGETVELQLRLRDGEEAPDISPLENDFAVVDVRRSTRTQIVNGHRDDSVDWQLTLAPLRTGALEVPALRAGDAESERIALEVLEEHALDSRLAAGEGAAPVYIETEVDDPAPYVQGKVGLTIRVLLDERVLSGSLTEPTAKGAAVQRSGEDRRYDVTRDGRRYQVVERQYAIFPQRSGPLEISPVVFEGRMRAQQRRARRSHPFASLFGDSFFDDLPPGFGSFGSDVFEEMMGGRGRPVRTASTSLRVDVKPRNDDAGEGWWLPARNVELVEQWEVPSPVFRVGEPVNRSVAIRATGLSGAQLPPLELPEIEGMKQYAEPATLETASLADEVVSIKLQKVALVPTRAGQLTLPAIELSWWDTARDEARTATLPARTVEVLPAAGLASQRPAPGATGRDDLPASASAGGATALPPADGLDRLLRLGAGAGIALLAAASLVWAWKRRRVATGSRAAEPSPLAPAPLAGSRKDAESRLRDACDRGDPGAALAALREIARIRWPLAPPTGAAGWGARLASRPLEEAIAGAERARYAPNAGGWTGSPLWQCYRSAAVQRSAGRSDGAALPPLYPSLEPHLEPKSG